METAAGKKVMVVCCTDSIEFGAERTGKAGARGFGKVLSSLSP